MKKLYLLSILALLFTFNINVHAENTFYTNRESINMTEQQYHNLLELGFTEDEIESMDTDTFNANKNLEANLVAEEIKYYKTTTITRDGITTSRTEEVDENEYTLSSNNINSTFRGDGYIETTYKKMRTTISKPGSTYFRYKVTLDWKQMPAKRSYDIIGIGWEAYNVTLLATPYIRQDFTYSGGSTGYDSGGTYQHWNGGASYVIDLPDSTSITKLSSYMYLDVGKASGVGTIYGLMATGDYSHATSNISLTNAKKHTVNYGAGIVLDSSITSYYDTMTEATATWTGTW